MFVIGLTGGIGTGKTEVTKLLQERGAEVIDADQVAHGTYRRHTPGWREIVEEFGDAVLARGGDVDRGRLAAIVFEDEQALKRLNAIVHPRTRFMIEARIQELRRRGTEVVVVEIPLLVEAMRQETEWATVLDEIWVTAAAEEQVIERIHRRNRLDPEAVRARIHSQISQADRVAHAHAVIDNNGTLEDLRGRVQALWRERVPLPGEQRRQG